MSDGHLSAASLSTVTSVALYKVRLTASR